MRMTYFYMFSSHSIDKNKKQNPQKFLKSTVSCERMNE